MSRFARTVLLLLSAAALAGVFPGAAQAAGPYDRGHYSGSDSFRDTTCGLAVRVHVTFRGSFVIRNVKGSDGQAFLAHDNYEFDEVITRLSNGSRVTTHGKGSFHEIHARHVEGNVWEFEALDSGTFTLRDSSGNLLVRSTGVVKLRALFDTLGDGMPGGSLVEEEVTAMHGPHATDDEFCRAFRRGLR